MNTPRRARPASSCDTPEPRARPSFAQGLQAAFAKNDGLFKQPVLAEDQVAAPVQVGAEESCCSPSTARRGQRKRTARQRPPFGNDSYARWFRLRRCAAGRLRFGGLRSPGACPFARTSQCGPTPSRMGARWIRPLRMSAGDKRFLGNTPTLRYWKSGLELAEEDVIFDKFSSVVAVIAKIAELRPSLGLEALDRVSAVEGAIHAAQNGRRAELRLASGHFVLLPATFYSRPTRYDAGAEIAAIKQLREDVEDQIRIVGEYRATRMCARASPCLPMRSLVVTVVLARATEFLRRAAGLAGRQRRWLGLIAVVGAASVLRRLASSAQAVRRRRKQQGLARERKQRVRERAQSQAAIAAQLRGLALGSRVFVSLRSGAEFSGTFLGLSLAPDHDTFSLGAASAGPDPLMVYDSISFSARDVVALHDCMT